MDLRDKETEGHTQRVTEMTIRLAQEMQINVIRSSIFGVEHYCTISASWVCQMQFY